MIAARRTVDAETADVQGIDVLVFRARSLFGVCIDQITEIVEVEDFVRLTAPDASLRGALWSRGRPVPMIDVARRLGLGAPARYTSPVLLVTDLGGSEVGFLVDDPKDVVSVGPEGFRGLPELIGRALRLHAVYAVALHEDRTILLLDLHVLMTAAEAAEALRLAREALAQEAAS